MVSINPAGFAPVPHVPASVAVGQRAAAAAAAAAVSASAVSSIAVSTAATSEEAVTAAALSTAATSEEAVTAAALSTVATSEEAAVSTATTEADANPNVEILNEMLDVARRDGSSNDEVLAVFARLDRDTQNLVKRQVWENIGSPTDRGDDIGGETLRANAKAEQVLQAVAIVLAALSPVTVDASVSTTQEGSTTKDAAVSKNFFEAIMSRVSHFFGSIVSCVTGSLTGFANWVASWFSPSAPVEKNQPVSVPTNLELVSDFQRDLEAGDADVIKAHFTTLPEEVQTEIMHQVWIANDRNDEGDADFGRHAFEREPAGELVKTAVAAIISRMGTDSSAA